MKTNLTLAQPGNVYALGDFCAIVHLYVIGVSHSKIGFMKDFFDQVLVPDHSFEEMAKRRPRLGNKIGKHMMQAGPWTGINETDLVKFFNGSRKLPSWKAKDFYRCLDILMDELKHEIQPEVKTTQERLDNLAAAARISAEQTELLAMRNHYLAALDEKDQDHPDFGKYKPRNWFHEDFYYSMRSKLQDILYLIHMPNAGKADFDRQTFDIAIDGYSKAAEQGKGCCALLNTVLLLAFHDYLNRRSSHALQWLLIDTPLLGFDEGVHAISTSMRAGLFDALKGQAKDQQIIILENTDHIDELDFDSNVNLIRFTKNRHQGRYGYWNDVYDITETTPLR